VYTSQGDIQSRIENDNYVFSVCGTLELKILVTCYANGEKSDVDGGSYARIGGKLCGLVLAVSFAEVGFLSVEFGGSHIDDADAVRLSAKG
jgi:hypothetical protein